ncbi:4-oxalomesaconate tautomerase [Vibrio maritimus]|uniref:4-oxalomesaconate tautomerase n=1 Tax=Vibrio maritimus TaxID=990268 RepID=UPI001F310789|nr:4-oxalomesaconate tautomerase [Vibrio maritimus]
MSSQSQISCMLIRGGTSKGAYFRGEDLPNDVHERDEVLLRVMGSGDISQINGIGGGTTLTSKVAIVSKSTEPDIDLEYLFAQVGVEERVVDTKPSCGNILSGILAFAGENNLVSLKSPTTTLRVKNTNTNTIIEVSGETPEGKLQYEGDMSIDGVPGTGSPIMLNFLDVGGSKTGKLFPTGKKSDIIDGMEVTCIDAAVPMLHIAAESVGVTGYETKQELDSNQAMLERVEHVRRIAGELMGLGDVSNSVVPKVSLLTSPKAGGNISSRYFVPHNCHASHAVTGAIAVAAACSIPGTVASRLASSLTDDTITIEHPSGRIDVKLQVEEGELEPNLKQAALVRTARPLFKGQVYPAR